MQLVTRTLYVHVPDAPTPIPIPPPPDVAELPEMVQFVKVTASVTLVDEP